MWRRLRHRRKAKTNQGAQFWEMRYKVKYLNIFEHFRYQYVTLFTFFTLLPQVLIQIRSPEMEGYFDKIKIPQSPGVLRSDIFLIMLQTQSRGRSIKHD